MSQVGKIKSDSMAIKGNANMRTPLSNPGEIHFSFDGSIECKRSLSTLKVAGFIDGRTNHYWFDYAQANAYSFTEVFDLSTIDASDYDLLVVDQWVWSVSSGNMSIIKTLVDAGLSVVAQGNDSRTNVFVKQYDATLRQAHQVVFDESNVPEWFDKSIFTGSGDVFGGIVALHPGSEPWYYRADNGLIAGYMYTSPTSGAKMFFDQEAFYTENPNFVPAIMEYVASFSTANKFTNNLNITNRGLVIDRGATNLESGKPDTLGMNGRPFNSTSHTSGGTPTTPVTGNYGVPEPPFPGAEVWKVTGAAPDGYQRVSLVSRTADVDWAGYDKDYVASLWVYIPEAVVFRNDRDPICSVAQNNTNVDWHNGDNAPNATYGFYSKDITIEKTQLNQDLRGEWQQVWISFRPDSTAVNLSGNNDVDKVVMYFRFATDDDAVWSGTNFVYVSALQVEQRNYATSWTPDVRAGNQRYELPVKPTNDFTLAFEIIPNEHLYRTTTGATNAELFTLMDESASRVIGYWDYHNATVYSNPFFNLETDADWDNIQHHWHHSVYYTRNESHYVFLSKTGSTMRAIWYDKDFNLLTDTSYTYTDSDKMDTFSLSRIVIGQNLTGNVWACTIPKLSFYDYAITDEQMNAWMKPSFKVTNDGDLYCGSIEEQVHVPDNSYYFPLDYDAMDVSKTIDAEKLVNVHFQEGGAWVARPTTNLYTGEMTLDPKHGRVIEDGWIKLTRNDDTVASYGNRHKVDLTSLVDAQVYTVSYTVYNPLDKSVNIFYDWCDEDLTYVNILPNETRRIYLTSSRASYNDTYRFSDLGVSVAGESIWIKDIQIERKGYMSPVDCQTTGYSWLAYHFNRDIDLDWSADWSIVYFVKPIGTHHDEKSGYCISALGRYQNPANPGYIFWGKTINADAIYSSSNSAFNASDYFDKWHMVSLVNTGNVLTITEYDIDATQSRVRTSGSGGYTPTYFVTDVDVDFQLGSWTNGDSPSSAIFKDLIVATRAFTQEELDKIRKSWVTINSKTRVSGSFLEGII